MRSRLSIRWLAATLPKSSNKTEENEDAFFIGNGNNGYYQGDNFQCSISDGATRSSFSRYFAQSLVAASCEHSSLDSIHQVLAKARTKWSAYIQEQNLDWAAREKTAEGAYATLLWVRFFPQGSANILWKNTWYANVIGDTCLFQFRRDVPVNILPIQKSTDFNNHPPLLSSHKKTMIWREDWEHTGSWNAGDDFFLATDAMAKWIIQTLEVRKNPVPILKDRLSRKSEPTYFQQWISALRRNKEIRDDDTTIIWLKLLEP